MLTKEDYAVKFHEAADGGLGPNKAFPFMYSFVPYRSDAWVPAATPTLAEALLGRGITVAASSSILHIVNLERDYPFLLLWIKYSGCYEFTRSASAPIPSAGTGTMPANSNVLTGAGTTFTTDLVDGDTITVAGNQFVVQHIVSNTVLHTMLRNTTGAGLGPGAAINRVASSMVKWYRPGRGMYADDWDSQKYNGEPIYKDLRVSVNFDPDSRYLYGGMLKTTLAQGLTPIPVEVLQGYDYGYGMLKTRYMLPKQGNLVFEITNNNATYDIVVSGMAYGMKVRV